MKICIFVIISLALYSVSEAVTCAGRPNLIDSLTPFCSEDGDGNSKPACIDTVVSSSSKECTADYCAYYAVTIDNTMPEANGKVFGFFGCYGETLGVRVCVQSGDATTQASANSGSTTEDGVTDSATSGTLSPPAYGYKCASGTVAFSSATCDATAAAVTSNLDIENADGTTDTAAASINVVECDDGTTPAPSDTKTCKSCTGTDECTDNTADTTTECTGSCWAYIVKNTEDENDVNVTRGCLSDLDLTDSGFSPSTCTDVYKDGTCNEVDDENECIRCCTGNSCNTFKVDNILKINNLSHRTIPTAFLMVLSLVFTKLF